LVNNLNVRWKLVKMTRGCRVDSPFANTGHEQLVREQPLQ